MNEDPKTVVRAGTSEPGVPPVIVSMPAWQMVLVRGARTYVQALLGFLTVSSTGIADKFGMPISQFGNQFVVAAGLAVAPAVVALLMNIAEILTSLDVSRPSWRA